MLEARCQQLDSFCYRLEGLVAQLVGVIESLPKDQNSSLQASAGEELQRAAHVLQSLPGSRDIAQATSFADLEVNATPDVERMVPSALGEDNSPPGPPSIDEEIDDELSESNGQNTSDDPTVGRFGSLVTDSYGALRFIGGATNNMLVEAVQSITPGQSLESESPAYCSNSKETSAWKNTNPPFEIPFFVHGQKWRELPYLPKPEELRCPPRYVADLLVGLYFDQFHYTFPVLYKLHFMAQYKSMNAARTEKTAPDKRFLSVFFAVCACASSLIPSDGNPSNFSGLDYYEKALLLQFSMNGEASLERVQCLALLSMCCAGWNTLSTSWHFAGQAVRAAQDLGMHLSGLMPTRDKSSTHSPADMLKREISRRVWWSIYCIDRVISISLGRPMAAHDTDWRCALPLAVADEELEKACEHPALLLHREASTLPLSGFLAFAQLCHISGKVQSLHSPSRLASLGTPEGASRHMIYVAKLDKSLNEWLTSLPDQIRFSANTLERGPNLTMCVILFIVHAGSLLNLYRTLARNVDPSMMDIDPLPQCISAARSCINAAELVRELVPPSHHLAFCVHYLTLSGLTLVLMQEQPTAEVKEDIEKCVRFLKELEATWSGAARGRAIIEQLLKHPKR
ncbi:fungal-specific transcription factor domain-containing protein, partial [Dactylonectria estremocensis]